MPRKGTKKLWSFLDPLDPRGLVVLMSAYLESRAAKNWAPKSVVQAEQTLSAFIVWCQDRADTKAVEVTRPVLERYQRHLYTQTHQDGRPLSMRTQNVRLNHIRLWFSWLARKNYVLANPAADLELAKLPRQVPVDILTLEEAERVLAQPDVTDTVGLRDRALLETLYSTGIRRAEAALLRQWDVDFDAGTILIRRGKGGRVRTVPVGERALAWLAKYLADSRPLLVVEPDDGALFVGDHGQPAEPGHVSDYVKRHLEAAAIRKRGCCHLFRHTAATLMLQNGADIRFIQQFLGHACLGTTEIYTHVSIRQLKEVHTATHPGAKLDPRGDPRGLDDEGLDGDDTEPPQLADDAPAR